MKNGIIINGVKYEAVAGDVYGRCYACDLNPECHRVGEICRLFGPDYNINFKKLKDQDNGKDNQV